MAEIVTIGSPPVLRQVLADCLARGARLAQPGEFTLRAFLSGRLDLTRSEAVLGVIEARSRAQLDAALHQLAGGLAGPIERLRDRLLELLAHLEAGLDFVEEEDVNPIATAALARELATAGAEVEVLAGRLHARDRGESLPRVVLVGPPNAGKSRLLNALAGSDQALVSSQPGTTRDYVTARCLMAGILIELIDTAGVEPAADSIAFRAQEHGAFMASAADLILYCQAVPIDRVEPPDNLAARAWLSVATKCDLGPAPSEMVATSAVTGAGLDQLRAAIGSVLTNRTFEGDAVAATGSRCRESLARAGEALRTAAESLGAGRGQEVVAIDIRQALDDLGRVVGDVVTEDLLDRIFARFCIGK